MQMCPDCGRVYDESEYAKCPRCYDDYGYQEVVYIVTDDDGKVLELSKDEFEEFKRTHPGYI